MKPKSYCGRASALGLCALLAACAADTLSVGELRCRSVRCEPHPLAGTNETHGNVPRLVTVPEPVVAMTTELPCPGERCTNVRAHVVLLDRAGEQSPFVAVLQELFDARGSTSGWQIWTARWARDGWAGEETIELESAGARSAGVAVAFAVDSERPDEAVMAVSTRIATGPEHVLSVYRYAAEDDELELLFDDEHAGALLDVGCIDGEVVVANRFADVVEVTRYAWNGTIVWRQTRLESTQQAMVGGVPHGEVALRVTGDDAIAVLVPRFDSTHEVVLLGGNGEPKGGYVALGGATSAKDTAVRLAAGRSGAIEIAQSGYLVERASIREDEINVITATRYRTQYYDLDVYALDVAESGWSYVATQDGLLDERVELLDRISPERDIIESVPLAAVEPSCGPLLSDQTALRIGREEDIAYVASPSCFAVVPLPPLPE